MELFVSILWAGDLLTLTFDQQSKMSASGKSEKQSATPESTKKQVTVKVSDNNIKNTGKKKPRSSHPDVVSVEWLDFKILSMCKIVSWL